MPGIQELPMYTTVTCQTISPCGEMYAACSEDGVVGVWTVLSLLSDSLPVPNPISMFRPFQGGAVFSVTSTDRFLVVGGRGKLSAFDWSGLKGGLTKSCWDIEVGHPNVKTQINWMDADKQDETLDRLVLGCGDRNVYVHDL